MKRTIPQQTPPQILDEASAKIFVGKMLDRAMMKELVLTLDERLQLKELLKLYPSLLVRKGAKRAFYRTSRKPDLDGYNGHNGSNQ